MDDVRTALAGGDRPWQQALRAQEAGEYATAARLFAACAPDDTREQAHIDFRVGWCLELAGQPSGAAGHYALGAARARDPALAIEALYRLAWLALGEREFDRALPLLARLLEIGSANRLANPTVAHARYWLAVCIENDGRLIEAAACFGAIADTGDPDLWHEAAYRQLACLGQVGDFAGALAAADRLVAGRAAVRDRRRLETLQQAARAERAQIERARAAA